MNKLNEQGEMVRNKPRLVSQGYCQQEELIWQTNFDRDATNPSRDPLNRIGSRMNQSKTKRMNQALQGLINEKEMKHASEAAPN